MRFLITAARDPSTTGSAGSEEIDTELIASYMRFNEEMHRAGILIASEGLNPARKGARIGIAGGKRVVLDGPFAESKELVGGFYLVAVESLDEAIAWALRCPVGLGIDDVLTIHPMTEAADLPPELRTLIENAAPTWSASWSKAR